MLSEHLRPQNQALAFAMVSHRRLGKESAFAGLVPDLVQRIVQAVTAEAALFKPDMALKPIPINLTLAGDSVIELEVGEDLPASSPMKKAIQKTLGGWRWNSTFAGGFGRITPSRISWEEIFALAKSQIAANHRPGDVKGFPLLQTRLTCKLVDDNPARMMKGYERACRNGDAGFEVAFQNVWTCSDYNPCIGGDNRVLLAGGAHKLVRDVCVGDTVSIAGAGSGTESATVTATWRSRVNRRIAMVSVKGVLLTPDHPVCHNGTWCLPASLSPPETLFVDAVFNFALSAGHCLMLLPGNASGEGAAESVEISDGGYVQCCTLGKDVPGMPDPLWGTARIFEAIRTVAGYPAMVTVY
mmetsp:Transcript_62859/g.148099  ORF Transcript_62859/g.148099 Transcript_62859/m.148099 type:complete len:356 (+) Transcript_62859:373-1440(+)